MTMRQYGSVDDSLRSTYTCATRTRNIRARAGPLFYIYIFSVHKIGRAKALPALPLAPALQYYAFSYFNGILSATSI